MKRITEGLTYFFQCLFFTSDDWKQCKELPIFSRDLSVEELLAADIHINFAGKICLDRPLVPFSPPSSKTDEFELAGETILTSEADNNDGGQGQDNPGYDGSSKEEDQLSDDSGWKTSGAANKQAQVSDDKTEVDQLQLYYHALTQTSLPVVPNNSSGLKVKSEVSDSGNTP